MSDSQPFIPLLSDQEAWQRMPKAVIGTGKALPNWAKAIAVHMPRTAAAMLELDMAQRLHGPLNPILRGKLRWVVAHANHCMYSEAAALADLRKAGMTASESASLIADSLEQDCRDRDAMEFVRLLTVAAPTIEDSLFERLRDQYGDHQTAAMVLLAAYGNFQDRIVLGLNLPVESSGPLDPLPVKFADGALQVGPLIPQVTAAGVSGRSGKSVVPADPDWNTISYDELQQQLQVQRRRKARLPIPAWESVREKVPAAIASQPTRIVWNLVCYGYVPELAVPWTTTTRTHWAECPSDRVFEESLFWIQTRAIGCNYCMGHCEMLLETAGLTREQVVSRTKLLAESDWSAFPPAEQRAYDFARKLSRTPWRMTEADYRTLEADLGPKPALAVFWWLCRGLYMTRISDGFQLPLENDNVFSSHSSDVET